MRYYIDRDGAFPTLIDREGELEEIVFNEQWMDFYALCDYLNAQEMEKLKYKKKYNNLKFRIKKIAETI